MFGLNSAPHGSLSPLHAPSISEGWVHELSIVGYEEACSTPSYTYTHIRTFVHSNMNSLMQRLLQTRPTVRMPTLTTVVEKLEIDRMRPTTGLYESIDQLPG